MINFINGDILDSDCQALVTSINCSGIIPHSLHAKFCKHFSNLTSIYQQALGLQMIQPGSVLAFQLPDTGRYIFSIATCRFPHGGSLIADIDKGLMELRSNIKEFNIESIAIPAIGCGIGRLPWKVVRTRLRNHLKGLRCRIDIYEPLDIVIK